MSLVDPTEFAGRVALVTGGTRGIGWAICEALARRGCNVQTCGSTPDSVESASKRAGELHLAIEPSVVNAEREDDVAELVGRTVARQGRLDILVVAAGRGSRGDACETTMADWDRCLSLNLRAPFLVARLALPPLIRTGDASIVFISSIWAVTTTYRRVAYTVAKSGLVALTRALAIDHAADGVRVNAVAPGYVETVQLRQSLEAANPSRPVEQLLAEAGDQQPMKRLAQPDEIAEAVAFLAGRRARSITGQTLVIDGGITTKFALADQWR